MTTLVYIENVLGSGQMVKLTEQFGDYSVSRDLRPGESARLVVSDFKTLNVEERPLAAQPDAAAARARRSTLTALPTPRILERRRGRPFGVPPA